MLFVWAATGWLGVSDEATHEVPFRLASRCMPPTAGLRLPEQFYSFRFRTPTARLVVSWFPTRSWNGVNERRSRRDPPTAQDARMIATRTSSLTERFPLNRQKTR